jgi:hypothetical protein
LSLARYLSSAVVIPFYTEDRRVSDLAAPAKEFYQASIKEIIMSKAYHSTKEGKKKPLHSIKEKKALKLERKRAAEHVNPEIKVVKGAIQS